MWDPVSVTLARGFCCSLIAELWGPVTVCGGWELHLLGAPGSLLSIVSGSAESAEGWSETEQLGCRFRPCCD